MITYTHEYHRKLFTAIKQQEKECPIDDFNQRRHIEDMKLELHWLTNDVTHKKRKRYKMKSFVDINWNPKVTYYGSEKKN